MKASLVKTVAVTSALAAVVHGIDVSWDDDSKSTGLFIFAAQ